MVGITNTRRSEPSATVPPIPPYRYAIERPSGEKRGRCPLGAISRADPPRAGTT